ncbi:nucleotide exchange factor GrpE [Pseudochrobactrum sp. Wa41.01b-1]|uniref:nucleotide exchange factor GrpE n=1 Tax=Pseudochrobactrum sp. Wa41.01b-1 TaxID=2864102 RepID=UPI001C689512|nr:nucleotide exchange factor GrpE [Pseudochrobactrum sp. Wa41.01b-1]QYM72146.1 nucleotide exchange factor GrpE [Pseudochrobactrum sp. Wa41.01b-1]
MADEKKNGETPDLGQRDLNNPRDRDALKRAADDFLKARKDEAVAEAAEDDAAAEDAINPLAELQVENNALKDQMLRLAADMENLRKRTAREMQDAKAYAVTNFARDMLSVSDNLRRALDAIPTDALAEDTGLKALAEGVEMTERAMINALERHGVTQLSPEGQKFDPNFHQAIFEVPNAEVPNNTVVQVMQTGYAIGERVLRPAMVGVSRGGPKE